MSARGLKFFLVGAAGLVVQLGMLALLTSVGRFGWLMSTAVAVECAIVHNFCWHVRWTWRDRTSASWLSRFAKFHAGTAVTSIGGNLAVMAVLVPMFGVPIVPANVISVVVVSAANFLLADRWVFREHRAAAMAVVIAFVPAWASAEPPQTALDAWRSYVVRTDAALETAPAVRSAPPTITANGDSIGVDGGTISRWHGAVFVKGMTLDQLLHRLEYPGTPPPQADVTASRVLARDPGSLRVYMRLVRHAIVTVAYDTEHVMTFRRTAPTRAVARSVATRIDEVGGGDSGFLWKLNSYWRYDQLSDGVAVSVETLTLSRSVPVLVRPIAGKIVERVARESMVRTLTALKQYVESDVVSARAGARLE